MVEAVRRPRVISFRDVGGDAKNCQKLATLGVQGRLSILSRQNFLHAYIPVTFSQPGTYATPRTGSHNAELYCDPGHIGRATSVSRRVSGIAIAS